MTEKIFTDSNNTVENDTNKSKINPTLEDNSEKSAQLDVLAETPYTVKIIPTHAESFELQVSAFELVQEIHRVLMDREETCTCTCFSLQLNGQCLDVFAELKTVEGLRDGAELKVVEERYTVREAKNHVKHVHDLFYSIEPYDAYAGREQMSLCFTNAVAGDLEQRKTATTRSESLFELAPPSYVTPCGSSGSVVADLPLIPLHLLDYDGKSIKCVRQLNYSNWNPPPPPRRLMGDLLYLFFHTLEEKRFYITACPRGFYVNMSTEDEFNPHPVQHAYVAHSLIDLLRQLSPGFKKNFDILLKRRATKHPFERVPTPYQVFSWLSPKFEHSPDSVRKEEAFSSRMACEENLPGQTRDWNEELQVTHELPQSRLTERLLRDRAVFKSNSDFVAAATRAAISVINGDIMAINPGETRKQQMFIWNNMFFSLGFDVKDHYKEFGGECAAFVATSSDLAGVRAYSMLDHPGLHTLGTAVIDYRGYRVTAQTIIPGILEKEQEQLVVYGSIDFGKTVITHPRYSDVLAKTAKQLKIRPHKVVSQSGEEVELFSSVDCKGIVGNDGRTYILDLLRTLPPDLNYFGGLPADQQPELPASLTQLGYPYSHRHLLSTLRQELIEAFFEYRHDIFLRLVSYEIQKLKNLKSSESPLTDGEPVLNGGLGTPSSEAMRGGGGDDDELTMRADEEVTDAQSSFTTASSRLVSKRRISVNEDLAAMKGLLDEQTMFDDADEQKKVTQEAISRAAKAAGSSETNRFDLCFNPDVYQRFLTFADSESEAVKADKLLVCDACEFLVTKQIPGLVKDCVNLCVTPQDGRSLVEIMHQHGINVRYLNRLAEALANKPSMVYLKRMIVTEILVRSAKHLFRNYVQDVDPMLLSVGVIHFLNCFLSTCSSLVPLAGIDEQVIKLNRNKKGKKKVKSLREAPEEMAWTNQTPVSLWSELIKEAKEYYHFNLAATDIDSFCAQHEVQRVHILRAFCPAVGIQLLLRDYQLTPTGGSGGGPRHRPVFTTDDVVSLYPVVKHLHPHATDAYHYFTTGQARISAGRLQEGFELVNEALGLLNGVYGPLHPDIGACNRLLARLSYIMGEHQAALLFQHRATMISERVHGVDNPNTVTEYIHFALYCFSCGRIQIALQLLYRARYLALLCHGELHPEMTQIDTNIGLMLQSVGELDLALVFLQNAVTMSRTFYGEKNLKEAFTCHLISRTHAYRGDFRSALDYEKQRYAIYRERFGTENDYTRDSDDCLRHLTQQAVSRARRVAEIAASNAAGGGGTAITNAVGGPSANNSTGTATNLGESAASLLMEAVGRGAGGNLVMLDSMHSPAGMYVPTMASVLETLNRINGILVIQLRNEDNGPLPESAEHGMSTLLVSKSKKQSRLCSNELPSFDHKHHQVGEQDMAVRKPSTNKDFTDQV